MNKQDLQFKDITKLKYFSAPDFSDTTTKLKLRNDFLNESFTVKIMGDNELENLSVTFLQI